MNRAFFLPLVAVVWLCTVATGCEKVEIRDLAKQEKKWLGTWQVTEIKTVTTDTLGAVKSTVTLTNQGSMDFRQSADATNDPFKTVAFEGPCAQAELVYYFTSKPSGERTATGGWSLYWDADPDGARVLLWAIGPSSSYHRTITLDSDDDSARQLYYTYRPLSRVPNEIIFATWTLRK